MHRRPVAITVLPSFAPPMNCLLSIVVPFASSAEIIGRRSADEYPQTP